MSYNACMRLEMFFLWTLEGAALICMPPERFGAKTSDKQFTDQSLLRPNAIASIVLLTHIYNFLYNEEQRLNARA